MVYTWFRRVCTCLYKYKLVYTRFNYYKHVHTMYIHVCTAKVLCTEGYIHFMKCTDIVKHGTYTVQTLSEQGTYTAVSFLFSFFICPAGWPVGRARLLPGVTSVQVQAN